MIDISKSSAWLNNRAQRTDLVFSAYRIDAKMFFASQNNNFICAGFLPSFSLLFNVFSNQSRHIEGRKLIVKTFTLPDKSLVVDHSCKSNK